MPHPRMYADDDPHLDDVRRVCLALPEIAELVETSYRQVALKRQLKALEAV